MKEATLLVVRKPHQGDSAVDNVVKYMVTSPFATLEEIMAFGIRTDSIAHMIEDFYAVQDPLDMERHRRVFHMILTTRTSRVMDTILEDGAIALRDYCALLGHQVLLVPHDGSACDCFNHHWHAVINPISYMTGQRLLDKFETYHAITAYLNQNTRSAWSWKFSAQKDGCSKK